MIFITWGISLHYHKTELFSLTFFTYNFMPNNQEGIVWASWTLGVEMVFYLMFPLIFKIFCDLKKSIVLLFVASALALLHGYLTINITGYKTEIGLFHQLPVFAVGIITFHIYKNYLQGIKNKNIASISFIGSFIILFFIASFTRTTAGYFTMYLLAVAYAFLLLGLSLRSYKTAVNKATIFLGIISYSLYLNHPRIVYFMIPYFRKVYNLQIPDFLKITICMSIVIVPVTIISYFTYNLIEKPGAKLIRKVALIMGI